MLPSSNDDLSSTFTRLQQSLRGYLRRRTGDAVVAEDLLQEVFLKALTTERAGKKPQNLVSWLYVVARTTLADYYRATGIQTESVDEDIPNHEEEDLTLHEELSACVKSLIDQLDPIYRDTLLAVDIKGETMRSLALKHNVSISAIKSRASRARRILKHKLLACCRVEMKDGLVSDYERIGATKCGEHCE